MSRRRAKPRPAAPAPSPAAEPERIELELSVLERLADEQLQTQARTLAAEFDRARRAHGEAVQAALGAMLVARGHAPELVARARAVERPAEGRLALVLAPAPRD